ncbi:MAG: phospholipase D-like domain-containing protein [Candidatus Sumerlaeaceae bacterium]|jgi:phosphatidylserine/phosphatidylglycerophosphate/cardiolipin synthase-like enzyme
MMGIVEEIRGTSLGSPQDENGVAQGLRCTTNLVHRTCLLAFFAAAILLISATALYALPAKGVCPINNREYIAAVRKLVQHAHSSIAIMLYQTRFYEEYPDTQTNHLLRDLIEAKLRGVDVKILIDTGSWNPSSKNEYNLDFVDRLTTSGIEIWEDSPEDVSHEKVICVDDDFTVVSSHNWTYYSIAKNNEVAVVIESQPVNEFFRHYFTLRCNEGKPLRNAKGAPQWPTRTPGSRLSVEELGLRMYPVDDVTPMTNRVFFPTMHEALLSATRSITVVQRSITMADRPHPMPGEKLLPGRPASEVNVLLDDLIAAHKRGVDVTVVLDQTEDFQDSTNDETADYLKSHGVRVLRDDLQTQTHAKLVVIDDRWVSVGSTNWTPPALESGNEASVLVTGAAINKVYRDYVQAVLENAAPYQKVAKDIWKTPSASRSKPKR